ncbi:hypothetical protein FOL47_007587 [Perkinsus chesapeaki]|uniref:Uncharacterized protein n=1 Tax=Perkinsus chesapeaki TaxID=330153 RepID=A0A7J6LJH8_PERCH|nr:hypothetical protein FOL47_007587 [Perkinsus chesapeaki]
MLYRTDQIEARQHHLLPPPDNDDLLPEWTSLMICSRYPGDPPPYEAAIMGDFNGSTWDVTCPQDDYLDLLELLVGLFEQDKLLRMENMEQQKRRLTEVLERVNYYSVTLKQFNKIVAEQNKLLRHTIHTMGENGSNITACVAEIGGQRDTLLSENRTLLLEKTGRPKMRMRLNAFDAYVTEVEKNDKHSTNPTDPSEEAHLVEIKKGRKDITVNIPERDSKREYETVKVFGDGSNSDKDDEDAWFGGWFGGPDDEPVEEEAEEGGEIRRIGRSRKDNKKVTKTKKRKKKERKLKQEQSSPSESEVSRSSRSSFSGDSESYRLGRTYGRSRHKADMSDSEADSVISLGKSDHQTDSDGSVHNNHHGRRCQRCGYKPNGNEKQFEDEVNHHNGEVPRQDVASTDDLENMDFDTLWEKMWETNLSFDEQSPAEEAPSDLAAHAVEVSDTQEERREEEAPSESWLQRIWKTFVEKNTTTPEDEAVKPEIPIDLPVDDCEPKGEKRVASNESPLLEMPIPEELDSVIDGESIARTEKIRRWLMQHAVLEVTAKREIDDRTGSPKTLRRIGSRTRSTLTMAQQEILRHLSKRRLQVMLMPRGKHASASYPY